MVSEKPGLLIRFFYKKQPGEAVSKCFTLTCCGTFFDILTSRKRLRDLCSKQTGYAQRSLSAVKITYLKAFN